MKNLIKKFARLIGNSVSIPDNSETERTTLLAMGAMLSKQQDTMTSTNINDYEFKIFSQFGDDGIIQYLIKNVEIENETFIEFGVEDYMESNSRFLLMNNNWSGFIMDGSEKAMQSVRDRSWFWRYELTNKAVFIDRENINPLLASSGFSNLGILHIDLDGNDCYLLKDIDLSKLNPSIIILEYNAVFGKERPISVPYDKSFVRTNAHHSNLYWGASLPALHHEAEKKGYALVGCNIAGNNAYYVRKDLLTDKIKEVSLEESFKDSKFRECRDQNGNLTYATGEDRLKVIKGLDVYNVVTDKMEKL